MATKKKQAAKSASKKATQAKPSHAAVHAEIDKAIADVRAKQKNAAPADKHKFDAAAKALGSSKKVLNIIWPF